MYTNYIFDLYGTLIDINTDEESTEFWYKLSLFYSFKGALYTAEELKESYITLVKSQMYFLSFIQIKILFLLMS